MSAAGARDGTIEHADLDRLDRLARMLDSEFRLPGTRLRFGLDPLVGLLPVVGDSAMAVASLWIVYQARRLGASRATLVRMVGNVALDTAVGAVPLLGDVFDASFRANRRNVELLRRQLRHRRGDRGREAGLGA